MGKIGSTILTFLFSIPVTAVGFMAIFGVPPIAALNASPKNDDVVIRDPFNQDPWSNSSRIEQPELSNSTQDAPPYDGNQQHGGHLYTGNATSTPAGRPDLFSNESPQLDPNRFNNSPASASPHSQPLSTPRQFPNQPLPNQPLSTDDNRYAMNTETNVPSVSHAKTPANEVRNSFGDNAINAVRPNTTETSAQMLNWQEASARLAELGIRKYHLERGGDEGMFMFVCLYHPSASPQVTHRFEAEGNDPLVAVNQVISQVDGWLQKQYQESHKHTGVSFTR